MHSTLYIPKTITVGFQERSDTFTGKLGYVIYTDHMGKLRKEGSWNGWRNKTIDPVTVDNTPQTGFTFNKGIKRDGHWGSGRSVIRVYDPRDFEFEISVDNLIGVLMHSDVSKRDIVEQCVYAWSGTDLVLLPTNSVEYQESVKHTDKQSEKVSAKSLVPGRTYSIKKDSTTRVVYLGRFDYYTIDYTDTDHHNNPYAHTSKKQTKKKEKKHIFFDLATKGTFPKEASTYLAYCESDDVHPEFASFMDIYYHTSESQPIVGLAVRQSDIHEYGDTWKQIGENQFAHLSLDTWRSDVSITRFAMFNHTTKTCDYSYEGRQGYYSYYKSYPGRTLPGMHENRADLLVLLADIKADYEEWFGKKPAPGEVVTLPHVVKYSNTYENQREFLKMVRTKYKLGFLQFTLQDGKVSTTNRL